MTPDEARAFRSHGTRTAKLATSGPGGQPHVMPVWFVLDGEELVFTTGGNSVKGQNLRRDPRAALVVDEEVAPYAFVHIRGHVTLSEDLEELLRFATAGVREVRFHDLRHTFGTRCAAAGVPLRTLQAWMGHADIKTTMVYTHYAPGANEAELVNGVFAPADPTLPAHGERGPTIQGR